MKFRVLCLTHTVGHETEVKLYRKGDVIETDKDLVAAWNKNGEPPMFERVSDDTPAT